MKFYLAIVFLGVLLLSGCGVQVIPRPAGPVRLEIDKETVTSTENALTLSAKLQDLDFGPYTGVNNITAFYVTLSNHDVSEHTVPLSAFLLIDQDKKLYRPLEPDRVSALTQQEKNYLIPYPYVGFYYLQDSANFDYATQSSSLLAYSPQDSIVSAASYALPVGVVPPGASISGMVYFNIDLYEKKSVDLSLNLPSGTNFPETKFTFIFDIVK